MGDANMWVIEARKRGTTEPWTHVGSRVSEDAANRFAAGRNHLQNMYEYRVVEYRRIEPAPEDSGAGEKE